MLVGMCSVPEGLTETIFFEEFISDNLFHKYRIGRGGNIKRNKSDDSHLYDPLGYKTFGDNNLMFISLFDDFSYPNRVFHPFNGNGCDDAKYQNYEYQLIVGLNTMPAESRPEDFALEHRFAQESLRSRPFACVTRLKVNPVFLCGNGLYFTELIKKYVYLSMPEGIDAIVLNGVGSDELIIAKFADSMRNIAESVFKIRNLQFSSLKEADGAKYAKVLGNAYVGDCKYVNLEEAHVFSSSYSICGYAMDRTSIKADLPDDGCRITFNWTIKPGHIHFFTQELYKRMKELGLEDARFKDRLYVSRTKVCLSLEHGTIGAESSRFFEVLDGLREIDVDKRNIRKLHVEVSVEDSNNLLNIIDKDADDGGLDAHPSTRRIFGRYAYDKEFLSKLRANLGKARVSKVIKERVMKMYHNYNDCVQDPAFVLSFIGFRKFLDFLSSAVKSYGEGKSGQTAEYMHEWLDNSLRDFEQAYLNRFHQSNRMRTLSDFNLEWNGGIQQIISSMDFTYKTIMKCCGVQNPKSFMYISGYERVHVTDHSYRINMQHVTYPELFVTTVWKELFNFISWDAGKCDSKNVILPVHFYDEEYIERFKVRVYSHRDFNPSNAAHSLCFHGIDKELMVSIVADTFAFYYGYGSDYGLFMYWYTRYLMQTPMIYTSDGKIDPGRFMMFMVRMLYVRMISGGPDSVEELRLRPFDPAFGTDWMLFFDDAATIASILYEHLKSDRQADLIRDMSLVMLNKTYPKAFEIAEKCEDKEYVPALAMAMIDEFRNKMSELYTDSFRRGELLLDGDDEMSFDDSGANFILCFLPCFLKYIRSLDLGDEDGTDKVREKLLKRDADGMPDIPDKVAGYYSNLLADPFGGFFCIDGATMKAYFSIRSLFYMNIFHLYHRNIAKLITP